MSSAPCWRAVAAVTAVAAAASIPPRKPARLCPNPEAGTHMVLQAPAPERVQTPTSPPTNPFVALFALIVAAVRPLFDARRPAFPQLVPGRPFSDRQRLTSAVPLPGAPDG